MQEARSPAYFTHYTNLFGSLSHQALARDSWSLWLMRLQMMLHWSFLKFTTCITGHWHEEAWKTTPCAARSSEQLSQLTLPPRSLGFASWQTYLPLPHWLPTCFIYNDWGRQAGEDLSHKPCYHCNWEKVLFCPLMHRNLPEMSYHVPAASQQQNAPQCPQGSDGWIGFAQHRQAARGRQWTPQAFLWHCAQSTVTPTRATGVNTVLDLLD